MPDATIMKHIYKKYMNGNEVTGPDMNMLLRFFHEIVGCVNLNWREKALKGGEFSQLATTSDEAFALFIMKYYNKLPKKDIKKEKLVGIKMDEAIKYYIVMMTEIKEMKSGNMERVLQLDKDIRNYIKKLIAHKKGHQDNSESNQRKDLKNLYDFDDLLVLPK